MISKYEAKEAEFLQKQDCLRIVVDLLANLKEVAGVTEIMQSIERLTDLEQKDRIKTQNQFLEEISSLTGKFSLSSNCTCCIPNVTLKELKKKMWRKKVSGVLRVKKDLTSPVSNLDDFDMDVIRNKINEFYIVSKQIPTLRTLLELKERIVFSGSHETLRQNY